MFNITPKIFNELNEGGHYLSLIQEIGQEHKFSKGASICRVGDRADKLFYMTSGLVKCFYINDGKELILRLMADNSAVLSYSGFITNSPSSEYIECLQPCEGFLLPIAEIEKLRVEHPKIDLIFRYMAEQHYLSMERRLIMLHHKSAEDRYHHFCQTMEEKIVKETPKHCIASYLGMTAESFSRMKKKLTK